MDLGMWGLYPGMMWPEAHMLWSCATKETYPSLGAYQRWGKAPVWSSLGLPVGLQETPWDQSPLRRSEKGSCSEQVQVNPGWSVVRSGVRVGGASRRRSTWVWWATWSGRAASRGPGRRLEPDLHMSQNQHNVLGAPGEHGGSPDFPIPILAPTPTLANLSGLVCSSL